MGNAIPSRSCDMCSATFHPRRHWQRFCSQPCRSKDNARRQKADGRYHAQLRKAAEATAARRLAQPERQCPFCGEPMQSPRRVQCGAPNCQRLYTNARARHFQKTHKAEHGQWYSRRYGYKRACLRCGDAFLASNKANRWCSLACSNAFRAAGVGPKPKSRAEQTIGVAQAHRNGAKRRLTRAAKGSSGSTPWVGGRCAECGGGFVCRNSLVAYCSRRCKSHAASARRRALEAGAEVSDASRYRIHRRDGWICHICQLPTNRKAVFPAPDFPTIDHVVALAAGGAHHEDNLKTAHFICNSRKRELPLAEVA